MPTLSNAAKEGSRNQFLSDLVKINFKDANYLANNGRSLCTVPMECMQELLSSLHLIQIKNLERNQLESELLKVKQSEPNLRSRMYMDHSRDEAMQPQQLEGPSEKASPIKVGQIFYMQFYFTGECIYHDHHNNKLILSQEKRTAFKIIEHISKSTSNSKEHQTYDYIGNVVPYEHRYLIVIANELLYLKFADHSIYLGSYDEKSIVTFTPSLFHIDRPHNELPLYRSPCRLYSVEQEKYVAFDLKNKEIVLKSESVCIQGMCLIEHSEFQINEIESPTLPYHRKKSKAIVEKSEESNKIAIRILQRNNRYFMVHLNSSAEKLMYDINRMIHPIEEKLNSSNTFLMRYEPTFSLHKAETTFNLSNISSIGMANNPNFIEEEEKEEIIEELTLREINFGNLSYKSKEEISFQLEIYPTLSNQHQIFIYDQMATKERINGKELTQEKLLYLDYRENLSNSRQQCILKEYNSRKLKKESSKYKNILRIEFITRTMLEPYIYYYALLLNLKLYNYYCPQSTSLPLRQSEERYKMKLNLLEIQEILSEYYQSIEVLSEVNKDKCSSIFSELLELNFIGILEQLLQAIIVKKKYEEREEAYSIIRDKDERDEDYHYESIPPIETIASIIFLIVKTLPQKAIHALLNTDHSLLFIRICKFQHINRYFSEISSICSGEPKEMLKKLEETLKHIEERFSGSKARNICILWAYRLLKAHQMQSSAIDALCQQLVQNYKSKLSDDFLIILELIKLSKGELFYTREVVKFLSFQRLQQEEISFSLRDAYFSRIVRSYSRIIQLPFRLKHLIEEATFVSLERDNKRILQAYLEEVLPKNVKFQSIQNKLFSFRFCELYLYFNEGIFEEIQVDQQECKNYLPLLITVLEEHLGQYIYEKAYEKKYIVEIVKCLRLTLQKYMRYIVYEECEIGLEDDDLILRNCLEEYEKIIVRKEAQAQSRRSNEPRDAPQPTFRRIESRRINRSSKRESKLSKKGLRSSKKKEDYEHRESKATRILEFFSLKKMSQHAEIIECIDKSIIWDNLNSEESLRISNEEKLTIFEEVVKTSTLLLSPAEKFREYLYTIILTPLSLSRKFLDILVLILNKAYQYNLWRLIQSLAQSTLSQEEWRAIIAIINTNQLLKYFILYEEVDSAYKPSEAELHNLFQVLNQLLARYLEWSKSRIDNQYFRTETISDNFIQIQANYHHFEHDLEPESFITLLSKVNANYSQSELQLHTALIKSIGAMTSLSIYHFYSEYIIRYECQHYNIHIVKLIFAFFRTLTAPLRTEFANNFQYSLFKQSQQIKELVCTIAEVKQEPTEEAAPQRATNFNILTELRDRKIERHMLNEQSGKEFLSSFFRLLTMVEKSSVTHKEILSKLTYNVLIAILVKYNSETLLKYSIMNFILINIERLITYGMNKYLKSDHEGDEYLEINEEEENEEYASLLNFIKHSNYLLQKEIDAFKVVNLANENSHIFIKYVETLLSIVKVRDSISKYLNFEGNEKGYRTNSDFSDSHTITSNLSAIREEDASVISGSLTSREDANLASRVRQLMHYHSSVQINETELDNIEGINKLLCYEVLQTLDELFKSHRIPPELQQLLLWLENYYKITLSTHSILISEPEPERELIYQLDKTYFYNFSLDQDAGQAMTRRNTFFEAYRNTSMDAEQPSQQSSLKSQYESINDFLSMKVENYLVLLIELLQRHMVSQQKQYYSALQSKKQYFQEPLSSDEQILHLLILIEYELNDEIQLYKLEDEQYKNKEFEVLPEEYYQRSGMKTAERNEEEKYKEKCCQIEKKKLEVLLGLLMVSHKIGKPIFLYYFHAILERITYYNIVNQTHLQQALAHSFDGYYDIVYNVIQEFRSISPIVNDAFFVLKDHFHRDRITWEKIYGEDGDAQIDEAVEHYEQHVNSLRGVKGYHLVTLNYYMMVKMLLACSKTLNFEFKELFARPTIDREPIISELIDVLELLIGNSAVFTEEKFEFLRVTIKLINTFLRGPIELNIELAINRNYSRTLITLLEVLNRCKTERELFRVYLIGIKKLIAEGLFILIPFIELSTAELRMCEEELRESYLRSKHAYPRNYENIISDYIERRGSKDEALLYFDLALNFYYCLIEIYSQKRVSRIYDVQIELLNRRRREKRNRKNWMVFYQLYEIMLNIFAPLYRRLTSTYEDLTDEKNEEQLLHRAILFFTRHVSHVDVRIYSKTKKISFLLLKEAGCHNVSIRKEFYRLIGREQRELRLHKFMKVSKYIIIRLEINKNFKKVIENFKPLEIVLLNRQLWKSMCFLMALLLNLIYIFQNTLVHLDAQLFLDLHYAAIAFTYTFILFLFLIYAIEIFPLKLKVYRILTHGQLKLRPLKVFLEDKTLGFAVFYSVFLTLSIYYLGFVSVLLFDYFFRFKVSSKITFIMVQSTFKIAYVVILLFTLVYITALLTIQQEERLDTCIDVASCTQDLFYIFMELRFNVTLQYTSESVLQALILIPRLFLKLINISLLVGIIFMEKRKEDQKSEGKKLEVRDVCFICGNQRNSIERARNSNKGFYYHVEMEHNLWNYVYYLVYLKNKERKNLNTIETTIIKQWDNNQIDWLPDRIL